MWYRRVAIADRLPQDMDRQDRDAAIKESRATLLGMLESFDCFVMDPVSTVRASEHKPRQLELAYELGIDVPRTLTTNPAGEWFWLDDVFGPRALSTAIAETLLGPRG